MVMETKVVTPIVVRQFDSQFPHSHHYKARWILWRLFTLFKYDSTCIILPTSSTQPNQTSVSNHIMTRMTITSTTTIIEHTYAFTGITMIQICQFKHLWWGKHHGFQLGTLFHCREKSGEIISRYSDSSGGNGGDDSNEYGNSNGGGGAAAVAMVMRKLFDFGWKLWDVATATVIMMATVVATPVAIVMRPFNFHSAANYKMWRLQQY